MGNGKEREGDLAVRSINPGKTLSFLMRERCAETMRLNDDLQSPRRSGEHVTQG